MNKTYQKKPKSPCTRECTERFVGCAVTCTKWGTYVEERNKYYEEKIKDSAKLESTPAATRMYLNK